MPDDSAHLPWQRLLSALQQPAPPEAAEAIDLAPALRRCEARLHQLAALAGDWVWEQDADLHFTAFAATRPGLSAPGAALVGRSLFEVADPVSVDLEELRTTLLAGRVFRDAEIALRQVDGSLQWLRCSGTPVIDETDGHLRGYVGVATDVTRRRQKEGELHRQAEVLDAILRNLPGGLTLVDERMRVVAWNQRMLDLLDLPAALFADGGPPFEAIIRHNAYAGEYGAGDPEQQIVARMALARVPRPHRFERPRRDGTVVEIVGTPIDTGGFVTLYFDRTAERQAESLVHRAEMSFRTLFTMFPVGVAVVDHATGDLMMANDRVCAMVDAVRATAAEGAIARIASLLRADSAGLAAFEALWRTLPEAGAFGPLDVEIVSAAGEPVPSVMHGTYVRTHDTASPTVIVTIQDISERKAHEQRLWQFARVDALTGLPNRTALREKLEAMLAEANASGECFAVGLVDLDGFKDINDSFGHGVGDEYLKTMARRLAASLAPGDTVCRLGGDEFALILRNLDGPGDVQAPLRAITRALNEKVALTPTLTRGGGSVGVALFPSDGQSAEDLLRNADIALYSAKAAGRGRSLVFEAPMRLAHDEAVITRAAIDSAIDADRIGVYYQPIVRAGDGVPLGFEALVRWLHPDRGPLAPGAFLAAFDDAALVARLDRRVREKVFADAAAWRAAGIDIGRLGVNLAGGDFTDGMLPREFQDMLATHHLDGRQFCVEVTEGMFLGGDTRSVRAQLEALRALGVEIAFDDFGTGFASLSHLRRFPIDRLKIDRSFVAGVDCSPDGATIVRAVIQMAHNLGLKTTAEGVETEAELHRLRQFGCDQVQGYLLGRPIPADEVPACLARLRAAATAAPAVAQVDDERPPA